MYVIGEKINATRSEVTEIIEERNDQKLAGLAAIQVEAGADLVDVNVADRKSDSANERENMLWAVEIIENTVDVTLVIDSADPEVIEVGVRATKKNPPVINSISGSHENPEAILSLAREHGCKVIALAMDKDGIPTEAEKRLEICKMILAWAEKEDFSPEGLIFDPLVLPISVEPQSGKTALKTIQDIKALGTGAQTVMGLSNVSFGLPRRSLINQAFVSLAAWAGLDYSISDPLDTSLMNAIRAAEAVLGQDQYCRKYITAMRKQKRET